MLHQVPHVVVAPNLPWQSHLFIIGILWRTSACQHHAGGPGLQLQSDVELHLAENVLVRDQSFPPRSPGSQGTEVLDDVVVGAPPSGPDDRGVGDALCTHGVRVVPVLPQLEVFVTLSCIGIAISR